MDELNEKFSESPTFFRTEEEQALKQKWAEPGGHIWMRNIWISVFQGLRGFEQRSARAGGRPSKPLTMVRFGSLLGVLMPLLADSLVESLSHLNFNFCKWCEASRPVCREQVCLSNCSESSFCDAIEEICVSVWKKTNESIVVHTMCHNPALPLEGMQPGLLHKVFSRECHMTPQPSNDGAVMVCGCRGEHECNDRLLFDRRANGFARLRSKDVVPVVIVSLVPLLLVASIVTATFYCYRTRQAGKPAPLPRTNWTSPELRRVPDRPCGVVRFLGEGGARFDEPASGVASVKDCVAVSQNQGVEPLPIRLEVLVGKGRFAEVWRAGLLQDEKGGVNIYEDVAVKVFPAIEYTSWRNEWSIFADPKLKHDNVVQFLAAEERGPPGHRKFWLVLDYHSHGNLQEFLRDNVLSWRELVVMATSVARGLAYLHSDTTTSGEPKVPVAHRDLKSSNIVVKKNQQCALCDFGLALRLDLSLTVDDFANSGQVGTARYMAPEVLESRVNLEDLETFKQMDVYSLALVLWEMGSRCQAIGEVKSYQPAFGSQVCDQPSVDSMRDLVLRDRGRPEIPLTWTQHQGMSLFCSTVIECWDHDPEARLTAHCVLERFSTLHPENRFRTDTRDQHEEEEKESWAQQQNQAHSPQSSAQQVLHLDPNRTQPDLPNSLIRTSD